MSRTADIGALCRVWLGRIPLRAALADGSVTLHGAPDLVRGFAQWFAWSPMAAAVRQAAAGRAEVARRVLSLQWGAWYRSAISPVTADGGVACRS